MELKKKKLSANRSLKLSLRNNGDIMKYVLFLLVTCISLVSFASETRIIRNAKGMKVFTATTSGNTTIYRNAKGLMVMTAVENKGKITYRDAKGRLIGRSDSTSHTHDTKERQNDKSFRTDASTAIPQNEIPVDDYQLLRDVMKQRAVSRISTPIEE